MVATLFDGVRGQQSKESKFSGQFVQSSASDVLEAHPALSANPETILDFFRKTTATFIFTLALDICWKSSACPSHSEVTALMTNYAKICRNYTRSGARLCEN